VNVPVQLVPATRDLSVRFHQLHEPDGARIETRRVCSAEGVEVPWEQVGRGYELEDGSFVILTDEELEAADPEKTRTIDIEAFVEEDEIDPIYYDHPYFLVPEENEGVIRAYHLLREVMERSGRVALARFVLRTKEYLVAIRVRDGALALATMRFHDEVRRPQDLDGAIPEGAKPAKKQLDGAVALIEELSGDFQPGGYEDEHRKRLLALIEQKRKGEEIQLPEEPEEPAPVPDLMAALEESLKQAREGTRKPRQRAASDSGKGAKASSRRRGKAGARG
jgi:DNA end-binding protein Ku